MDDDKKYRRAGSHCRRWPSGFVGGNVLGAAWGCSLVIERLRGVSALPRAALFHLRTIEMFRSAGIEDEVRAQSEKEFMPEGAIVAVESLAGKQIAAFIPSLNEGVDALSPCRRLFVTQPGLEPILRTRAERAGARVVDGLEVISVEQDNDSVTVVAQRCRQSQRTPVYRPISDRRRWRAQQGARTHEYSVRWAWRFFQQHHDLFPCRLAKFDGGANLSVIYIVNPALDRLFRLERDNQSGFFAVNTMGDTSKPEAAMPPQISARQSD